MALLGRYLAGWVSGLVEEENGLNFDENETGGDETGLSSGELNLVLRGVFLRVERAMLCRKEPVCVASPWTLIIPLLNPLCSVFPDS